MSTFEMSKFLKKDLLEGSLDCIRNGYVRFDAIDVSQTGFKMRYKGKYVGYFKFSHAINFAAGESVLLHLEGGKMKIKIIGGKQ